MLFPGTTETSVYMHEVTRKCCVWLNSPEWALPCNEGAKHSRALLHSHSWGAFCHLCVRFFHWSLVMGDRPLNVTLTCENQFKTVTQSPGGWKNGQSRQLTQVLFQNSSDFSLVDSECPEEEFHKGFVQEQEHWTTSRRKAATPSAYTLATPCTLLLLFRKHHHTASVCLSCRSVGSVYLAIISLSVCHLRQERKVHVSENFVLFTTGTLACQHTRHTVGAQSSLNEWVQASYLGYGSRVQPSVW